MTGSAVTGGNAVELAVAVNGVVAGVTETVAAKTGGAAWWVTLAPEMFTRGHNTVEVFQILGGPTNPRLVPVRAG